MRTLSVTFSVVLFAVASAFCQTIAVGIDKLEVDSGGLSEYDPLFSAEIRLPIIRSEQRAYVEVILSKKIFERESELERRDEKNQIISKGSRIYGYDITGAEIALIGNLPIIVSAGSDVYAGFGGGTFAHVERITTTHNTSSQYFTSDYIASQSIPAYQRIENIVTGTKYYPSTYICAGLRISLRKDIKLDIRSSFRQIYRSKEFPEITQEHPNGTGRTITEEYRDQVISLYANLNFKLFKK